MRISNLTGHDSWHVDAALQGVPRNNGQGKVTREETSGDNNSRVADSSLRGGDNVERLKNALIVRGMEMRYVVNEVTGNAQIVISETGTGREVLKIPSDPAFIDSLLRTVDLRR